MLGGHLFWITSRAAGTASLLLASVSVAVGLLFGGRLLKGRAGDLKVAHEALALATLATLALHALSLLGDRYLSPSLADLTVPFVSAYQRWWTALGVVAGWSLMLLGLSYYARGRIGARRWRALHRFTALAWLAGLAHALGEGTDAGSAWFLVATAIVVVPAALLLVARLASAGRGAVRRVGERPAAAATARRVADRPAPAPEAAAPRVADRRAAEAAAPRARRPAERPSRAEEPLWSRR